MYVAPYFLIAFAVNFGLLAFLGWASDEPVWAQDARLLGCAVYAASVALVFSFAGLRRVSQGSKTLVKNAIALAAEYQARELARDEGNAPPVVVLQPAYPRSGKASAPQHVKGELVI